MIIVPNISDAVLAALGLGLRVLEHCTEDWHQRPRAARRWLQYYSGLTEHHGCWNAPREVIDFMHHFDALYNGVHDTCAGLADDVRGGILAFLRSWTPVTRSYPAAGDIQLPQMRATGLSDPSFTAGRTLIGVFFPTSWAWCVAGDEFGNRSSFICSAVDTGRRDE